MDPVSKFYSQPSHMSNYPTYERTQVRQRGGTYSGKSLNWTRDAALGTMALLGAPMLKGMLAMAKKSR